MVSWNLKEDQLRLPPGEKENHLQNAIFAGYVSSLEGKASGDSNQRVGKSKLEVRSFQRLKVSMEYLPTFTSQMYVHLPCFPSPQLSPKRPPFFWDGQVALVFATLGAHAAASSVGAGPPWPEAYLSDRWFSCEPSKKKNSYFPLSIYTPPKFNIAPEKLWLENYFPIGKGTFQGLC